VRDGVGAFLREPENPSGIVECFFEPPFEFCHRQLSGGDHERLFEPTPCRAPKLLKALGEIRSLPHTGLEKAQPRRSLPGIRGFGCCGSKLSV
jgi:hypothetical protein